MNHKYIKTNIKTQEVYVLFLDLFNRHFYINQTFCVYCQIYYWQL